MEASQQEFLTEIYEAPTITVSDLIQAGVRLGRSSECARPCLSAEVKQRALEYLRHAPECTRSPNTHSTAACWPGSPWKARLETLASSSPTCAVGTPAANARESCPLSKWPERVSRPIMSLARRSAMGGELLDCHLRCSLFRSRAVACRTGQFHPVRAALLDPLHRTAGNPKCISHYSGAYQELVSSGRAVLLVIEENHTDPAGGYEGGAAMAQCAVRDAGSIGYP